jgi:hypothetical protein
MSSKFFAEWRDKSPLIRRNGDTTRLLSAAHPTKDIFGSEQSALNCTRQHKYHLWLKCLCNFQNVVKSHDSDVPFSVLPWSFLGGFDFSLFSTKYFDTSGFCRNFTVVDLVGSYTPRFLLLINKYAPAATTSGILEPLCLDLRILLVGSMWFVRSSTSMYANCKLQEHQDEQQEQQHLHAKKQHTGLGGLLNYQADVSSDDVVTDGKEQVAQKVRS